MICFIGTCYMIQKIKTKMEFSGKQLHLMASFAACSLVAAGFIGYFLHKLTTVDDKIYKKKDVSKRKKELLEGKVTFKAFECEEYESYQFQKSIQEISKDDLIKKKPHNAKRARELFKQKTLSYDLDSLDPVDDYIVNHSLREPDILKELRLYTLKNIKIPEFITNPLQSQFFRLLLNMLNAKKCLEVGMYTGYNTLSCALTIPPGGIIYALEINQQYADVAQNFFKKADIDKRIKILLGDPLQSINFLIEKKHTKTFDFIYIDTDSPFKFFDRCLQLLRYGGIIALNNTLYQGLGVSPDSLADPILMERSKEIHELNKRIKNDNRFQLSFLKLGNGVTVCRKIPE